jgi:hypothetical protein
MIDRPRLTKSVLTALRRSPVVAILGPRQCGKTTLAKRIARERKTAAFFDLEMPVDLQRLESPLTSLEDLKGLVVIDEVQYRPELFKVLRVLSDRSPLPARFLILGSASPDLVRHTSETLAGRVEFIDMGGFDLHEVGIESLGKLWIRGSFPRAFLARTNNDSAAWRQNFVRTFLERDVPNLGITIPPVALRRFWTMLAHYHGQMWNASEIGRSFGLSDKTVRGYLDILCGTFMVRQLQPWFENVKKRQVKAPKLYLRDSGMLHSLLELTSKQQVLSHPKCGASWEGFAVEQVLAVLGEGNAYYWATHSGAELDLLVFQAGKRLGFEFKYQDAPRITKSMRIALEDLGLQDLYVVYPGKDSYPLDKQIQAVAIRDFVSEKWLSFP